MTTSLGYEMYIYIYVPQAYLQELTMDLFIMHLAITQTRRKRQSSRRPGER